ncbi:MAG: ATP-binding cassette domain-containing protein [Pseudomonadota bacterium]|nr:ATP-binding cassette domain-containing protein [Pseudomonadota bacterium]
MTKRPAPLLVLRDIEKTRRDSERVFTLKVSRLNLYAGDRIGLVGANGSGKSTLIGLLALAGPPDHAKIFQLNEGGRAIDVAAAWEKQRETALTSARARLVAYVAQRDGLLDFLTIGENIRLGARLAGERRDAVRDVVEALDLSALVKAYPSSLSGGQRQRAAVACALARRPKLILADEPTASLDEANTRQVMDSLCQLASEQGAALIVATHQLSLLDRYAMTRLEPLACGSSKSRTSLIERPAA